MIHAAHKPRLCRRDYHAYAEKLARDYGYAEVEPLDRAGIEARSAPRAYHGGYARPRRGAPAPARPTRSGSRGRRRRRGCASSSGSRVEAVAPGPVRDRAAGAVRARFVLIACNGYLGGLVPAVAARVMPINNFIVATEPLGRGAGARR